MLKCECGEEFTTNEDAKDHVKDYHGDVCDNWLQEYIELSITDAIQELISGEEE